MVLLAWPARERLKAAQGLRIEFMLSLFDNLTLLDNPTENTLRHENTKNASLCGRILEGKLGLR